MGGNFEFQVQDSFLEYFFLRFGDLVKQISLSEKKLPLVFVRLVICCTLKTLPDQKGIRGNVIKLPEQISSC